MAWAHHTQRSCTTQRLPEVRSGTRLLPPAAGVGQQSRQAAAERVASPGHVASHSCVSSGLLLSSSVSSSAAGFQEQLRPPTLTCAGICGAEGKRQGSAVGSAARSACSFCCLLPGFVIPQLQPTQQQDRTRHAGPRRGWQEPRGTCHSHHLAPIMPAGIQPCGAPRLVPHNSHHLAPHRRAGTAASCPPGPAGPGCPPSQGARLQPTWEGAEQQQSRAGVRTTLNRRAAAALLPPPSFLPEAGHPQGRPHRHSRRTGAGIFVDGQRGGGVLHKEVGQPHLQLSQLRQLHAKSRNSTASESGGRRQVRSCHGGEPSTSDHPLPCRCVVAEGARRRVTCSSRRRVITWQPRDMGGSSITFCSLGQVARHGQQAPSGPCWARAGGGSSDGGGSGGGGTHHTVAGAAACCDVSDAALRCIVGGGRPSEGRAAGCSHNPSVPERTCTSRQLQSTLARC